MKANTNEIYVLTELAKQVLEASRRPENEEKRRLWIALRELKAKRPMILAEAETVLWIAIQSELKCEDEYLRGIETNLRMRLEHQEIGDDFVMGSTLEIPWDIHISSYGVPVSMVRPEGPSMGYVYNFPIQGEKDAGKLIKREFTVDREKSLKHKAFLEEVLGGIMEVSLTAGPCMHTGLTSPLFSLIGMENMLFWMYDEPDLLNYLISYLCDDKGRYFKWLEDENLLALNNDNHLVASGSPGFTSELPKAHVGNDKQGAGKVQLSDLWCFTESQETLDVSPEKYEEFVLPYLVRLSDLFGFTYYGCCEPVSDRLDKIKAAFGNLRSVSVSGWCDKEAAAEMLGDAYVYSNKPMPAYMSGTSPDWEGKKKEVESVLNPARKHNCQLEFILRDVYDIGGDSKRFAKWADMMRAMI